MEIEAKIPVSNLSDLFAALSADSDTCVLNHAWERDRRFDLPDGSLGQARQVLRVRNCDGRTILTWKGPADSTETLARREEIETDVSDSDKLVEILTRLGYAPVFTYEKVRSEFCRGPVHWMLDHTPIGDFAEIEGPSEELIRAEAALFGLDYAQSTSKSYQQLFREWQSARGVQGSEMTFEAVERSLKQE